MPGLCGGHAPNLLNLCLTKTLSGLANSQTCNSLPINERGSDSETTRRSSVYEKFEKRRAFDGRQIKQKYPLYQTPTPVSRAACAGTKPFPGLTGVSRPFSARRGGDHGQMPDSAMSSNTSGVKESTVSLPKPHRLRAFEWRMVAHRT